MREVFRTESEVLLFGGSGTGTMESAVANLCSPGDRVLVVSAGYFGERWAAIAKAYGADVDHLRYDWGEIPSAEDTAARLREREATVVFFTHSETSTGVVSDPQPFAAVAREAGALSWSTRSPASARCRSRPTRGASTSSPPARRRR